MQMQSPLHRPQGLGPGVMYNPEVRSTERLKQD